MSQLENICWEIFLLSLCKYLRALSPSTLGNIMSNLEENHFLEHYVFLKMFSIIFLERVVATSTCKIQADIDVTKC